MKQSASKIIKQCGSCKRQGDCFLDCRPNSVAIPFPCDYHESLGVKVNGRIVTRAGVNGFSKYLICETHGEKCDSDSQLHCDRKEAIERIIGFIGGLDSERAKRDQEARQGEGA